MIPVPYLFFPGNCREALTEYARIFGAPAPDLVRAGDAPPDAGMPAAAADQIMHAALRVGDGWIFASDDIGGDRTAMAGVNVHLGFPTPERARAVFEALAAGGEVRMPFAAHFWSRGFGALTDRFGIRWMIDTDNDPH